MKVLPNQVWPTHSKPVVDMPRFAAENGVLFMRQSSEKTETSLQIHLPKVRTQDVYEINLRPGSLGKVIGDRKGEVSNGLCRWELSYRLLLGMHAQRGGFWPLISKGNWTPSHAQRKANVLTG